MAIRRVTRVERTIGVIYRPETELASHYFQAVLPEQFDEYVWFDETTALPDTYPFGLYAAAVHHRQVPPLAEGRGRIGHGFPTSPKCSLREIP